MKTVKATNRHNGRVSYNSSLVNEKGTGISLYHLVNSDWAGDNDNVATFDELDDIIEAGKEDERWANIGRALEELGEGSIVLTNNLDIVDSWTKDNADTITELYFGDYNVELVDEE
ncbi:MAG: hypothetical protein PUK66_03450 [Bacteroidales bacterium]|uniref:hypothetical protein n=1 Tax=Porphyromonas sp. TaxID=1924944 RepID=UPI002979B2B9|nr:hypothetical protein [Porphyromonas sp.]MDD7437877.1 hypothetical protein [Bacteroidales bacterium]MDY3066376.1 hypothetical protein [Porphyromonas sp.]